jgi:hypothetical protein
MAPTRDSTVNVSTLGNVVGYYAVADYVRDRFFSRGLVLAWSTSGWYVLSYRECSGYAAAYVPLGISFRVSGALLRARILAVEDSLTRRVSFFD